MKHPLLKFLIFLGFLVLIFSNPGWGKIDPQIFSEIKPRSIGPAGMSGRIADIDVVHTNTNIIYVGTATGGVWKSINGGITWKPIFDKQPASSIGAVKIFQKNPNIIWVGTGEANPRNSCGVGRGIFKSIDAGKTWIKLGLEKTEKISRILLDPHNQDIAYIAALGTTWGENPERGVYKTLDGGKTWKKILYVDTKTGAADLIMAPDNPNKLIAAMWQHRRWPWFFTSGGPGSGIFLTTNSGKTWKKITEKDGLPKGDLGRIGLAFAFNKPEIVYALIEAKKNALLRSGDGGFTWKTINTSRGINGRPFYYADIRVNPRNENIIYSLASRMTASEDGGKNFKSLASFTQSHSDYHAMWNHPNGEFMIVGNDGGIVITKDRGKNWQFVQNLPLAQFYHISFDMETPYNIYGGLQDNGSWRGPNTVLTDGSIYNHHWIMVGFGDGFDTEPDPTNNRYGYAMSQGGYLMYFDSITGIRKMIRPTESEVKHRYNWNAGLAIDPFEPSTIYYGSQFVHRSQDKGNTWEIISPDLTTNNPEKQKQSESGGLTLDVTDAENHTSILCIAPSPVKQGIIWVGTDDGNIQLTKDNGKNWKLVSKSLSRGKRGVPECTWVPHIEASKFNESTAFVVFDDHRRANWETYIFVTRDYGKTWKNLATPEIDGFVHVIEQDHLNKNLLFLGTEFGLYVSFKGGDNWIKWNHGLPTVPVRDLGVHPRDNDLIIGTHGRAAYILDDISPLREISEKILEKNVHLFDISNSYQYRSTWASAYVSPGDGTFRGKNRNNGAIITYLINPMKTKNNKNKTKFKIEITDSQGKTIRELKGTDKKGIHRITWDLRRKAFESPLPRTWWRSSRSGSRVLPGTYNVQITNGDQKVSKTIIVKNDPRLKIDKKMLEKNYKITMEVGNWLESVSKVYKKITKTQKGLKTLMEFCKDQKSDKLKEISKKAKELDSKLKEFQYKIVRNPEIQGIYDTDDIVTYKINSVLRTISGSYEPLTQATTVKYKKVATLVKEFLEKINQFFQTEVEVFKKQVEQSGFSLFDEFDPIKIK